MHLLADSNSAFAINGFAGLHTAEQLSFWFVFILFNGYVVLEVIALAAFYFAARPRHGRPNPAAIWYFIASLWVVMAFISTVWAGFAEKVFVNAAGTGLAVNNHSVMAFIGLGFAAVAVTCMLIGALETVRRRRAAEQVLVI